MAFLSKNIDEELEDAQRRFQEFFDKNGKPRQVKRQHANKTNFENPGFREFYHALGYHIGSEEQAIYTKKARCFAGICYLVQPSFFLAMVVGLISIPLAFITQGEGWPDWIVNLAMAATIGPLMGMIFHRWIIETWFDSVFENIYAKELADKNSNLITNNVKYHHNWPFYILVAIFVFLFFVDEWYKVVGMLLLVLMLPVFTMALGFFLLVFVRIFRLFFPKKASVKKELHPVPDEIINQLKPRFKKIYQAMEKSNYDAAFEQFDNSEISREEYLEEIQNCFDYFKISQFHLPPLDFSDEEMFEVNPQPDASCEILLFLNEQKSQEPCIFYFICSVDYSNDEILKFSLVTVGC